jgi:hypothetical protein
MVVGVTVIGVAMTVVGKIALRAIGTVIVAVCVRWVHGSVRLALNTSTRVFVAFCDAVLDLTLLPSAGIMRTYRGQQPRAPARTGVATRQRNQRQIGTC